LEDNFLLKKPLIGVSILAVVILLLGSLVNVVGYQTVQTSQNNLIKEKNNQKELLFQTILDLANNKEIQQIIHKSPWTVPLHRCKTAKTYHEAAT